MVNLIGNVQISASHLGTPLDLVVPFAHAPTYEHSLAKFSAWATACHGDRASPQAPPSPVVIMQLCHTGRQSMRGSGRGLLTPAMAPSAVGVTAEGLVGKLACDVMFGTPKAMTGDDIDAVVEGFVQGARVAKQTGFDGIQVR